MISDDQLKICETKLLKRQGELIKQLRNDLGLDATLTEAASELSSFDLNHPADTATALYERSKDLSLKNRIENELEQINKALYAIEEGTYGICTICGEGIEYERLLALPAADKCKEHADIDDQLYDYRDDV
ncbi:MAG TPA: TraR/DksA C4-type zinc finger protein [Bacillota bacterium]|nr:TraR/DksA C4-type zinc finger protein [Bacillota bacterium]